MDKEFLANDAESSIEQQSIGRQSVMCCGGLLLEPSFEDDDGEKARGKVKVQR
jgi:hypothetical protein